jgi:hypothetical protein
LTEQPRFRTMRANSVFGLLCLASRRLAAPDHQDEHDGEP